MKEIDTSVRLTILFYWLTLFISSFLFSLLSAFSHLICLIFPGPPEGGLTTQGGWECGWRTRAGRTARTCLPWALHLVTGGCDSPDGGGLTGPSTHSPSASRATAAGRGACSQQPWSGLWSEGGGIEALLEGPNPGCLFHRAKMGCGLRVCWWCCAVAVWFFLRV